MSDASALGILETRGMAALVAASDAMLKAVDIRLSGRHGVGSGWVTVVVQGEVADVEAAIRIGVQEAEAYGEVITADVIPRPEHASLSGMPHVPGGNEEPIGESALGLLETRGFTPLVQGADALAKAAPVEIAGWTTIGGALTHVAVRGDVASVQAALAVGERAAEEAGDHIATLVIPRPADGIGPLLPPAPDAGPTEADALGLLETTGYAGAVAGSDAMVKTADVDLVRMTIDSGGRTIAIIKGSIDSVQAAVAVGALAAQEAGELNCKRVISRPDPSVMACFAGPDGGAAGSPGTRGAMGLIETRSTVALVKAVDQMLKAADVEFEGRYKVGYFLTAAVVRGDVDSVRTALEVGAMEAVKHGELVSAHLIPHPYPEMEAPLLHR
jgi:carbon dioxide concentrating mechanism protein CcmO